MDNVGGKVTRRDHPRMTHPGVQKTGPQLREIFCSPWWYPDDGDMTRVVNSESGVPGLVVLNVFPGGVNATVRFVRSGMRSHRGSLEEPLA